jgi:hypothetical protein
VASFLRQHGADVNMKNKVSAATCGLAVLVVGHVGGSVVTVGWMLFAVVMVCMDSSCVVCLC